MTLASLRLQTAISPGSSSSLPLFTRSYTPTNDSPGSEPARYLDQTPEPTMHSNLPEFVPRLAYNHANIGEPNLQVEYDDYEDKSMYTNRYNAAKDPPPPTFVWHI